MSRRTGPVESQVATPAPRRLLRFYLRCGFDERVVKIRAATVEAARAELRRLRPEWVEAREPVEEDGLPLT